MAINMIETTGHALMDLIRTKDGHLNYDGLLTLDVGHVFTETCNANVLAFDLLNQSKLHSRSRKEEEDFVNLKKYYHRLNIVRNGNNRIGEFSTVYHRKNPNICQRYTAIEGLSGQCMLREARHNVFEDFYVDIDMVNCHPVLTIWMCDLFSIECVLLKKYVNDREAILQGIVDANSSWTRDDAKKLVLSIIYGSKTKMGDNGLPIVDTHFVSDFRVETERIHTQVCYQFKGFYNIVKHNSLTPRPNHVVKDYNHNGRCMSLINQCIENQLLLIIFNKIKEVMPDAANQCILCYDGIMIPKEYMSCSLIPLLNQCYSMIDIPVILKAKPFDEGFNYQILGYNVKHDYTKDLKQGVELLEDIAIDSTKKFKNTFDLKDHYYLATFYNEFASTKFESLKHVIQYVIDNLPRVFARVGSTAIVKSSDESAFESKAMHSLEWRSMFTWYTGLDGKSKRINLSRIYEDKIGLFRIYTKTISEYDLTYKIADAFYTCYPFKAELVEACEDDVKPLLDFIRVIFCKDNDVYFDYFMRWLNFLFKDVGKKAKTCIVLTSKQGSGKGCFAEFLCEHVFGPKNGSPNIRGLDAATSANNIQFINKRLLVVNETGTNKSDWLKTFDIFKSLITDETQQEKKLYSDVSEVISHNNYMITTNHPESLRIEDSDRRFFVMACDERYIGDTSFWAPFRDIIYNQVFANQFYSYVYRLYDDNEILRRVPPTSEAKQDIQMLSKPVSLQFIDWLIEKEIMELFDIHANREDMVGIELKWQAHHLYSDFKDYCSENGHRAVSNTMFGRTIKNHPSLTSHRTRKCIVYTSTL